jgi:hypothetical protein
MAWAGHVLGVERASCWGELMVELLAKIKLL